MQACVFILAIKLLYKIFCTQYHFYLHTYTLMYIYIYSHPKADCFLISQRFCVARHAGHFKLGSKHAQLYVRHCILQLIPGDLRQLGNNNALCIIFHLFTFWLTGYQSCRFIRCLHYAYVSCEFIHQSVQPPGGKYIYCITTLLRG